MNFLLKPIQFIYSLLFGLGAFGVVLLCFVSVVAVFGYFENIYKLVVALISSDFSHIGILILRVLGLFVLYLGGVMGIFVS